jgi:D-alanine-D-alanine ligase
MKKVGLFFGGIGNEASVSIASAKNVIQNFNHKKYQLVLIYRDKDGKFYHIQNINQASKPSNKQRIAIEDFKKTFDIALPMTHGKYGEDGVLQSIFELQKVKYCGCRVLGSSLCMDKIIFKTFLQGQNIQQVRFAVWDKKKKLSELQKQFSLPIYVKPSNSGSSVGISKVEKWSEFNKAVKEA